MTPWPALDVLKEVNYGGLPAPWFRTHAFMHKSRDSDVIINHSHHWSVVRASAMTMWYAAASQAPPSTCASGDTLHAGPSWRAASAGTGARWPLGCTVLSGYPVCQGYCQNQAWPWSLAPFCVNRALQLCRTRVASHGPAKKVQVQKIRST